MSESQRYTSKDILDALRGCASRYGEVTVEKFENGDPEWPSYSVVIDRYGSWGKAKEAAGLQSNRSQKYTDEELLEYLRACKNEYGEVSPANFKKGDYCSVSVIMRRFGSWSEAKFAAGIEEDLSTNTGRKRGWSDEQILSHLKEAKRRLENDPESDGKLTTESLKELGQTPDGQSRRFVSPSVASERFGGWVEAKRAAGIDEASVDERTKNSRPRKWTRDDYIKILQRCEDNHGKVTQRLLDSLSKGDMDGEDGDDWPSSAAVRKEFGSWSKAKEKAGVSTSGSNYKHSKEELIEMLVECADRYDRCTANRFGSDDDFCSPETVQRRFGSWSDAKAEADVE